MATERISMPASGGGLLRYFDDYQSKIQINKVWIIIAIAAVVVVELLLQKGV